MATSSAIGNSGLFIMSIRAKLISFVIRRTLKGQLEKIDEDVPAFRERLASSGGFGGKEPDNVSVEPFTADGVSGQWVSCGDTAADRVLLYFHGGGYVFGDMEGYRDLGWRLSESSNVRVLMCDYRLAPEHPFPAAVEDATTMYRWLLANGYSAEHISIGGDSAGGGLAVAMLLNLKNHGVALPDSAVLISPWVDLSCSGESMAANAKAECMLSPVSLTKMATLYLGDLDRKAPLSSPIFGDLSGLPPMLIHVGSTEVLLSDAERLVAGLKDHGSDVELTVWPDMPHVFHLMAARIPEAKAAVAQLGEFVKQRLV